MGIRNKEGALFWATGIDNSGLERDSKKSAGIIKNLGNQISKFDVFAGLGAAAALTFGKMVREAYAFSKEFQTAMKEVQTISKATQENYEGMSDAIVRMSTEVPDSAVELSRAFYEIVSAGYDGAAGLAILEAAAKGAVAGVTSTTVAADGLTTILNAWKLEVGEVTKVNDIMFRTVELGKITYDELAGSIANVAPLASAAGVSFEEIGAAVATITKQGTPASEAVTRIRSAMIAMNKELGSGWGETMTLQEGFQSLSDKATRTGKDLEEVTGRVEGALAVFATTGKNAKGAAADIASIGDSALATEKAYRIMAESADVQLRIISNNYKSVMKELGDSLLLWSGSTAKALNDKLHELNYKSLDSEESYYRHTIDLLTNNRSKRREYIKKYGKQAYEEYLVELKNALENYKVERDALLTEAAEINDPLKLKIKTDEFQKQLDEAKKNYDEYEMLVANGFKKEAELFYGTQMDLGDSYREYLKNQLKVYEGDMVARKMIYLELSELIKKETEEQKKAEEEAFEPLTKRLEALRKITDAANAGSATRIMPSSEPKTTGKTPDAISREMFSKISTLLPAIGAIQSKSERVQNIWDNIVEDITNPDTWSKAASGVRELGNIFADTNQQVGDMMNGVSNIMGGISNMLLKGASPQDMLIGGMQAIGGLAQIFQAAGAYAKTFDDLLQEMNKDLEKQQRLLEISYRKGNQDSAFQGNLDALAKEKEMLEKVIMLGKEQVKQAEKAGFFGRLGTGVNLNKLQEELTKYENQLEDVNVQIEDLGQTWKDFTAGLVTELDLADQIAEAFKEGKTSAADFASYINDILGDAILEVFKASILGPQLTLVQEYLANALKDKDFSPKERAIFDKLYNDAVQGSADDWNRLGLDEFFKDKSKKEDPNSLAGSIRASLTEETGSVLAGTFNAMRLDMRELVIVQLAAADSLSSIDASAKKLYKIDQTLDSIKNGLGNLSR